MASTITLYSLGKKINSTERPTALTPKLALSGEYLAPVDVLAPVVLIEVPAGSNLITDSYNYAYSTELGRYYWIDDVIFTSKGMAELHLSVDVLASYRNSIGGSTQFVARSASQGNTYIVDGDYPLTTNIVVNTDDISAEIPWTLSNPGRITDGYYVIGIINNDASAIGAASYYVFDQTGFDQLRNVLMSSVNYTGMAFTQIEQPLYKSLYNPFQYITSVTWFPIKPPIGTLTSFSLYIGYFDSTTTGGLAGDHYWKLDKDVVTKIVSNALSTVNHPQVSDGAFYNAEPYTQRKLIIQPFGEIPIDSAKLLDPNHSLKVESWIDWITGDCTVRVVDNANNDTIVGGASGVLGVPISISQFAQSAMGIQAAGLVGEIKQKTASPTSSAGVAMKSAAHTFASRFEERNQDKGVWGSKVLKSYQNRLLGQTVTASGTNGSLLNSAVTPIYETQFILTPSPVGSIFGIPLYETKQINTLSGYIQTENAHIEIAGAYHAELTAIENFMDSGFYYE